MATEKKCLGIVAALVLSMASCGPDVVVTEVPADRARLQAIVTMYAYACRDLRRPPKSAEELLPIFKQAKIENPNEFLISTRDGKPYSIIWGLDLAGRYRGSKTPVAYESVGKDGKRLLVTCDSVVKELSADELAQFDWPKGYIPERSP